MKKSTIWTFAAVVIIALGGGVFYATQKSNSNQVDASYNSAIQSGKEAVKDKNYTRASNAFDKALSIKKTDQAQAYKEQADNMTAAIKATKDGEYDDALAKTNDVIKQSNGYSVLVSHGKKLTKTIKDVQDNYEHEIKPIFAAAKQNEDDKQYDQAADQYQKVLDLPYIDGKYYAKYKKQASDGLDKNKQAAKDNKNEAESSSNSSSNSANSNGGDTGNAGKTGEGSMGDHKVHGQTVTNDQIAQLRKRVTKLGYEGMAWSPQDLIDLYRKSGRANPDQITKNDVQSYLKP